MRQRSRIMLSTALVGGFVLLAIGAFKAQQKMQESGCKKGVTFVLTEINPQVTFSLQAQGVFDKEVENLCVRLVEQ